MEAKQLTYTNHIMNLLLTDKEGLYKTNKFKTAETLVNILNKDITEFKYENDNDLSYLLDIFDILPKLINGEKQLMHSLYDRFTYIHNAISNLLHSAPEDMNEHSSSRFNILKRIIDEMENAMLCIYLDNPVAYDRNKEAFIEYVIFTLKFPNITKNAIEKFPYLVNSINPEGVPLINRVLDHYLDSLEEYLSYENLGHIDDLIYYNKVLKLIMDSNKIKIDDYSIEYMLKKIKEFYESKNYTQNRHKEKLSFFVNDCINILTRNQEPETIDYLNYKYEIHSNFKEAHNLEAKRIYIANKKILTPTTKRKIYTFDGEGAFELDDGLSITYEDGIYHFGVHIADPGSYIDFNNILMDEAIRRTTSLYMENECIPLFPFILSGDTMSLNVGKQTYCMSYYYDIDERTGKLLNFDIKHEICEITGNLTYNQFDEYLNKGTDDQELFDTLINLSNISGILKGVYHEDPAYYEFSHRGMTESQKVIENAMIYNNHQVAKLASTRDVPFIYRCHDIAGVDKNMLNNLQENLKVKDRNSEIIKEINKYKELMARASYSRINTGHHGLGLEYYSHTTSPLRRLADIINIMCIKMFLMNTSYSKDDIKRMIDLIDQMTEQINLKRNSCLDYEIQYDIIKNRNLKKVS